MIQEIMEVIYKFPLVFTKEMNQSVRSGLKTQSPSGSSLHEKSIEMQAKSTYIQQNQSPIGCC
jgi:hypothetical protein